MWPFTRNAAVTPRSPSSRFTRGYAAAGSLARYGDFPSVGGSADYELQNGLSKMRNRIRFLARNSSTIQRYLQLLQDNVVGEAGIRFQSRVKRLDGQPDVTLNTRVEAAWRDWCDSPTVNGRMNIAALERQAIATWGRDGEVIWEIVRSPRYLDGVAVNPIEADLLDENLNTHHPATGNVIRMGVEIDQYGAPVAYHFLTSHPGDTAWFSVKTENRYRRVPAESIIHVFEALRPGQTRGQPPASAVINSIKMLDGYREAEVTNRRIAASTMGFFSRDLPKAEGITELADDENEEDNVYEMGVTPGTFKQLPDGMRFDKFDPGGSMTDYGQFEGQVKKDISMGLGISVFALGMETSGVSYSTGRSVLQEDYDFYKMRQRFIIDGCMTPLFKKWLPHHMLSDESAIPPTRMVAVVKAHVFRGRGWDWIDPAKDIKANAEALRTRQTSLTQLAAKRGIDRDDLLAEIADDEAAMKRLGLTMYLDDGKSETNENVEIDDEDDTNGKP